MYTLIYTLYLVLFILCISFIGILGNFIGSQFDSYLDKLFPTCNEN